MKPTASQYARALDDLYRDETSLEKKSIPDNFLRLLKRKKELKKLPIILKQLERLAEAREGVKRLEIIAARPVSKKELDDIVRRAKGIFNTEKIAVEQRVDPALKGGVILKTETERVDVSVSGKASALKKALLKMK